MYGALDISTSGMIAQRTRMETIVANIANQDVIRDSSGKINPYRRRDAIFVPGSPGAASAFGRTLGVHVASIRVDNAMPPPKEYAPGHPDAYTDGPWKDYIPTSNVNSVMENINAIEASRAYEANIAAAEATKQMMSAALRLIA